jgi:outer membrane receptor protein involved in Fe transport
LSENKFFTEGTTEKRLLGVYGELRAAYKNIAYLTVTGRNDWSSTLPVNNRSYFYPSVSGSVVFTELLPKNDVLSFGKIRASWAEVGKDADPYSLGTYMWDAEVVNPGSGGLVGLGNQWTGGAPDLKPEIQRSWEVGAELRFFNGRMTVDYTYYNSETRNQIASPRIAQSTGYIFVTVNSGSVRNQGMELMISGTPVETKEFIWDMSLNMAGNRGTLDGLPEGLDVMYLTDVQYANMQAASFNGGKFMAIAGYKWNRDEAGNVILDANGMPTYTTALEEIGNREATFTGGFNNTLSWKGFTFNMLWEFRVGGDVVNGTQNAMDAAGTSQFSADFRNKPLTVSGVDKDGNPVTNTWEPDKTYMYSGKVTSGYNIIKNYYTGYYDMECANYITNVNLLRLRSLSLSYNFPKAMMKKTGFLKGANVSVAANNVLLFTNYNGDPEAAAAGAGVGGSSSVGFDYCGIPSTTGMTFGINLTF